jgi:hypothetical protein
MKVRLCLPLIAGLVGCNETTEPSEPAVRLEGAVALVRPASGERFRQNDASLGCADHAARGHGFRIAFDWQEVDKAEGYKIVFWHRGSMFPAVQQVVTESSYEVTMCNAFVADFNLDHWVWRVAAFGPAPNRAPADTLWSEEREYGFEPCRLADGTPCSAPPGPAPEWLRRER